MLPVFGSKWACSISTFEPSILSPELTNLSTSSDIAYTGAQKDYIKKQMESIDLQNKLMRHDLSIILNDGLPSKTSAFGSMYRDARAFFDQTVDMFKTESTGSINVPGLEAAKKAVRENEARKRASIKKRENNQRLQQKKHDTISMIQTQMTYRYKR